MKDLSFLKEIEKASGESISSCYQCYRCTMSCPVTEDMDFVPHRVIRYIILGERDRVLQAKTIWACLQCYTCSVRCPNDIHIGHVFDTLRKIAVREGKASELDTWKFDQAFLESVRKHGRLHEMEAVMRYKLVKGNLFEDAKMGMTMLLKGRMGILPHNVRDRSGMKKLFDKSREE